MNELFCPIVPMPYSINMIQPLYDVNMIQPLYDVNMIQVPCALYEVVQPKYILYLLIKYNSNENLNLFFCFIQYETGGYYLCILDMTTNMSYYLRYDTNGIYYYDNQNRYHKINIPDDIPFFYCDDGYNYETYIGVIPLWANEHILSSTNGNQPVRLGNYFMYNTRALTPEPIPVATQVFTESSIIPVVKAVIVETDVQLDDDTEDNKIAKLISEYKTKKELENFIMESFTDLSEGICKKLSFDISKIEPSFKWNEFFKSVILSFGREYWKVNKKLRFKVVDSNLAFTLT